MTPERDGGPGHEPEPTANAQTLQDDGTRAEVDLRLEAASELVAYADLGLLEQELAAAGALRLISGARLHLKAMR
jgi:hypothetical protein